MVMQPKRFTSAGPHRMDWLKYNFVLISIVTVTVIVALFIPNWQIRGILVLAAVFFLWRGLRPPGSMFLHLCWTLTMAGTGILAIRLTDFSKISTDQLGIFAPAASILLNLVDVLAKLFLDREEWVGVVLVTYGLAFGALYIWYTIVTNRSAVDNGANSQIQITKATRTIEDSNGPQPMLRVMAHVSIQNRSAHELTVSQPRLTVFGSLPFVTRATFFTRSGGALLQQTQNNALSVAPGAAKEGIIILRTNSSPLVWAVRRAPWILKVYDFLLRHVIVAGRAGQNQDLTDIAYLDGRTSH